MTLLSTDSAILFAGKKKTFKNNVYSIKMAYGTACMIECSLAQVRNICTILIKNARLKSTNHAVFMLQASYFLLEDRPRRSDVLQAHMKLYEPKDLESFYL